jgi:hypothetical protein
MSPRSSTSSGSGIDLTTLVITAVASAGAAYTCSKIWAPGTLPSAAFTPVLIAVIKEALARPAKVVTQVVPVRGVVRSAQPADEAAPSDPAPEPPPLERVAQQGEISYHSSGPSAVARRWRLAIITGLLGFAIAAAAFTVPELVAGSSISGGGGTTFFSPQQSSPAKPAQTTTVPGRTVTVPAPTTVTVPAPAETVPAAPAVTAPAAPPPATTTPAPAPSAPTATTPPVVQP